MNDKEKILSLLNEFANPKKMASFSIDNSTPDLFFIFKKEISSVLPYFF